MYEYFEQSCTIYIEFYKFVNLQSCSTQRFGLTSWLLNVTKLFYIVYLFNQRYSIKFTYTFATRNDKFI